MATDPVRLVFFCVPKPTTTTSLSCLLSSCIVTLMPGAAFTSMVLKPTYEISSTVPVDAFTAKLPSMSEIVPPVVPFTFTVAPTIGSPCESVTVPFNKFADCWTTPTPEVEAEACSGIAVSNAGASKDTSVVLPVSWCNALWFIKSCF